MELDLAQERQILADAFDRYHHAILKRCQFQLSSQNDAEEVLQETFLRAWEYLTGGGHIENMSMFLSRVADNLVVDSYRRKHLVAEVSLDLLQEEGFEPSEDDGSFTEFAEKLDVWTITRHLDWGDDFDLLVSRYVKGETPSSIAQRLGVKRTVVSVRLHRALKKVARRLKEKMVR